MRATESDRRRAVVFVTIAGGLGGSTRSLATLMRGIGDGATRVLAAPTSGKLADLVREEGLAEATIPIPKPASRRLRRLSRPVAAYRIARWAFAHRRETLAIHANGLQEVSLVVPAALVSRVPLVMWIHDFEVYPWSRRLGPVWRRLLARRSVRWTAVSGLARRMIVEAGLADAEQVEVVANPIDPRDVRAVDRSSSAVPVVGFVAAADRRKGFHLLPDVDRALGDISLRWLLFTSPSGDGDPTWEHLRALPKERVGFPGKVLDVREAYGACDIVFCPSYAESFCRVAAEAMLNGIPVVASDIEPLRELIGDDEAGLLFPVGDVEAAGAAIRRLVADPALRDRLGERGRERASTFEPSSVIARFVGMYGIVQEATT